MARPLLDKIRAVMQPKTLFADAGYDAEWVHQYCRDDWQVTSWIPLAVHRKDGTVNGEYRSKMTPRRLKRNGYGKRWMVESFISGLKRTTGSMLAPRNAPSLFVEAGLQVLAYAIRRSLEKKSIILFSTEQDRFKTGIKHREHAIRTPLDVTQRMVVTDAIFDLENVNKRLLMVSVSTHLIPSWRPRQSSAKVS